MLWLIAQESTERELQAWALLAMVAALGLIAMFTLWAVMRSYRKSLERAEARRQRAEEAAPDAWTESARRLDVAEGVEDEDEDEEGGDGGEEDRGGPFG